MTRKLLAWPVAIALRLWQVRALERLASLEKREALVVATPGGGKTLMALRFAHQMLASGEVERVVVVCPSNSLRYQWHDAAKVVGIQLDPDWQNANGVEAEDYHGVVVTYAQVASAPAVFRINTRHPTLVILDEVHHAGDELSWGNAIREAFEAAYFRLLLSGTPFRHDNNAIPFVTYVEGASKADFEYSYSDALGDGVVRPLFFPTYDGLIRWQSRDGGCEERWLVEPLPPGKAAECWRAALDPAGRWLRTVLLQADTELTQIRADGHRDAAGLVFAQDQFHARKIGELLHRLTGNAPLVAISDDPAAAQTLKAYAAGAGRWLVAVRMVSEGFDVPRARVGVFATNVSTELFFRQAAGRLVRMVEGVESQSASLYVPAVEPLVRYALQIKVEREHQLGDRASAGGGRAFGARQWELPPPQSIFLPLQSEAKAHSVIYDGSSYCEEELAHATSVGREMAVQLPALQIAALLRRGAAAAGVHVIYPPVGAGGHEGDNVGPMPDVEGHEISQSKSSVTPHPPSLHERKRALRQDVTRATNVLAGLIGVRPFRLHKEWQLLGGQPQQKATELELIQKKEWLLARIAEHRSGRGAPARAHTLS